MFVSFGEVNDWTNYTLILPAIAVGNVGQLSVDLLLSTLNCVKIGCFYDKNLLFLVGNDPYKQLKDGECRMATGMDVYENIDKKLIIIQQRVPIRTNKTAEFKKKLIEWIKDKKFNKIILLSSCSTHARTDIQLNDSQFRFLTTKKFDFEGKFNWKRLELKEDEIYIPGGGLTKGIYDECVKEELNLIVFLLFCSEGDNRPEAFELLTYFNRYMNLFEVDKNEGKSIWIIPYSWNYLFGNKPPINIY